MLVFQKPGLVCQDLIDLRESRRSRVHALQSVCEPVERAACEHKLLFKDIKQVLTLVAADSHYSKIKTGLQIEDALLLHYEQTQGLCVVV